MSRLLDISKLNPPLNITVVKDEEALEKLKTFLSTVRFLGFDIETNMVNHYYNRRIRTLQLGNKEQQFVIDLLPFVQKRYPGLDPETIFMGGMGNYSCVEVFKPIVEVIKPALESKEIIKIGHNIEFDYQMAKWCLGIRSCSFFCTFLAEKILFAGYDHFKQQNRWGLKALINRYFNFEISKDEQCGFDLKSELTSSQIEYAALDCRLVLGLRDKQKEALLDQGLGMTAKIEFSAIPAFGDMHMNGMFLNKEDWSKHVEKVKKDYDEVITKMDEHFIPVLGRKFVLNYDLELMEREWRTSPTKTRDEQAIRRQKKASFHAANKAMRESIEKFKDCPGEANINYASPEQMLDGLLKLGYKSSKLPDTSDRTLKKLGYNDPLIKAIREFRSLNKLLSSYGMGFIENINPDTGRVHSRFHQIGAATGRPSSDDPNLLNIVNDQAFRSCFQASPGYKLITIDCAGQELRIMAEASQEPVMLDAFLKGWDVHSVGAEIIFGDTWNKYAVKDGKYQAYEKITLPAEEELLEPALQENSSEIVDKHWKSDKWDWVIKDTIAKDCTYVTKHEKCSCPGHKNLRNQIKAINFGIAYGMEAKKLADDLSIEEDEAQKLLDKYRASFPTLIKYLEESGNKAANTGESRTLSGRRRIYRRVSYEQAQKYVMEDYLCKKLNKKTINWEKINQDSANEAREFATSKRTGKKMMALTNNIRREGKNAPIQGGGCDIMKIAMGCMSSPSGFQFMWNRLETDFGAKFLLFPYDEFVVEAKEENVEEVCQYLAQCIKEAGAMIIKSIPMESEWQIDTYWKK
jgi:DNA polymerase I-like protein with 3'-5' exonuclease and polymerase domains